MEIFCDWELFRRYVAVVIGKFNLHSPMGYCVIKENLLVFGFDYGRPRKRKFVYFGSSLSSQIDRWKKIRLWGVVVHLFRFNISIHYKHSFREKRCTFSSYNSEMFDVSFDIKYYTTPGQYFDPQNLSLSLFTSIYALKLILYLLRNFYNLKKLQSVDVKPLFSIKTSWHNLIMRND